MVYRKLGDSIIGDAHPYLRRFPRQALDQKERLDGVDAPQNRQPTGEPDDYSPLIRSMTASDATHFSRYEAPASKTAVVVGGPSIVR